MGRNGRVLGRPVAVVLAAVALAFMAPPAVAQTGPNITVPDRDDVKGTAGSRNGAISSEVNFTPSSGGVGSSSAPASSGGGSEGSNLSATGAGGSRYNPSYSGGGGSAEPYDRTKDPALFDQTSGAPIGGGNPCTNFGYANSPCLPPQGTPSTPAAAGPAAAGTPASTVPRRSALQIARDAADRAIDRPVVYTSPRLGVDALVNLPTWLGVENWTPNTVSASEGGLTITVTARPASVVWNMGEGSVTCTGPGARYNPGVREESQSTDCSYTYKHSSAGQPDEKYQASATLRYAVTWSASNGESGSLGTGSRTTPFAMRVAERQALSTKAA